MTYETRADQHEWEHERALAYDDRPHSTTCACEECNERRELQGLPALRWKEPKDCVSQQSFDDDAWRIGGNNFEEHFFHFARLEHVSQEFL